MAYAANGKEYSNKNISRVKYNMIYTSDTEYNLPKAPELIKECEEAASGVFYNSASDYDPIVFDPSLLDVVYNNQIFFDVSNNKNFVVLSESISDPCLIQMRKFVNDSVWLLANGFWLDQGEWVDSEVWND